MTDKTLVIAGAGPTLGAALARRFGREGYQVALISRRRGTTDPIAAALAADGVRAAAFSADLTDEAATRAVFRDIRDMFGAIDVLEYSPIVYVQDMAPVAATAMTAQTLQSFMPLLTYGAITCVNEVLDDMLARKDGAIIITTAGSASLPVPSHAAIGAAFASARLYALALNAATRASGVFVGTVSLTVDLAPGSPVGDPDAVADAYFAWHRERRTPELSIVDPALLEVLNKRLEGIQARVAGDG